MANKLPPLTAADVKNDFADLNFTVYYIYIGNEGDTGWDNAQIAEGLLAQVKVYLATDPLAVAEWTAGSDAKGLVFNTGPNPVRLLTPTEVDDHQVVVAALTAARP